MKLIKLRLTNGMKLEAIISNGEEELKADLTGTRFDEIYNAPEKIPELQTAIDDGELDEILTEEIPVKEESFLTTVIRILN